MGTHDSVCNMYTSFFINEISKPSPFYIFYKDKRDIHYYFGTESFTPSTCNEDTFWSLQISHIGSSLHNRKFY